MINERESDSKTTVWVQIAREEAASLAERHRAFGRLVARYQDIAFGAAYGILGDATRAEDAAQEAFIAAWCHLPDLRTPEAFPAWLGSLVRTAVNRQTRRRSLPTVPLETNGAHLLLPGPHEAAERRERSAQVQAAIGALPESERLPLILFHIADYSREEIATFLGVSVVTVKRRLASARGKLRERLLAMLQDDLQEARPSNDEVFAVRVLAFTKLFRLFIDKGDSLVHSLNQLAEREEDAAFRAVIKDVNQTIQEGISLSRAMRKHPRWFAPEYIRAIREGETLGQLEVVLAGLADGTYTVGQVLVDTPDFDDVCFRAYEEARSRGHGAVLPEHLLLGLLNQDGSSALRELDAAGVERHALRAAVEKHLDGQSIGGDPLRFADSARTIQNAARQRAIEEGADAIRTRHLLYALSTAENTDASRLLRAYGYD